MDIKFYKSDKLPSSATEGSIWFDGLNNVIKLKTESGWEDYGINNNTLYEANLKWGGKNISNGYGPIDAAMVGELGANRFAFFPKDHIIVEHSIDSGNTWTEEKNSPIYRTFVPGNEAYFLIGNQEASNEEKLKQRLQITLLTNDSTIYTQFNKIILYISTNGAKRCYVTISGITNNNLEQNTNHWDVLADRVLVKGYGGYNVINFNKNLTLTGDTHASFAANYYAKIKFLFWTEELGESTSLLGIKKIMAFGGSGWSVPSNMAKTGHLYSWNENQEAFFPGKVRASGFYLENNNSDKTLLKSNGDLWYTYNVESKTAVTGDEGYRHIWFSDKEDNSRVHDDNFKYEPKTNTVTTNITGSAKELIWAAWEE